MEFIKGIDIYFYSKLHKFHKLKYINLINIFGNIFFIFSFIIVLFLLPLTKVKETSIISFIAFILDTIIVYIIKISVGRNRKNNDSFYLKKIDPYSFPSGHVSRLSILIICTYKIFLVPFLFIILTILVGLVRMINGYHYLSDCLSGLLIGLLCGSIAVIYSNLYVYLFLNIINNLF